MDDDTGVKNQFKSTDFVQVQHHSQIDSGEPTTFWRNALYVTEQDRCHVVIYTDGTKEVLHSGVAIRKAVLLRIFREIPRIRKR